MTDGQVRVVTKPWGREIIFAHTDRYAGKILEIDAGKRLSLQVHEHKEETLYLLSGRMRLETGPREALVARTLEPGACFHLPAGLCHRFTALEACRLVEVSSPELDDVVRLEDDFGRADAP